MEINPGDALKLVVVPLVTFVVGRWSKQEKSVGDHTVRLAVLNEQLSALKETVTIIQRDQKTQWLRIDQVDGKTRG